MKNFKIRTEQLEFGGWTMASFKSLKAVVTIY